MDRITDISRAVSLMNSHGAAGEPFLFAFDYELSEALFISSPLDQQDVLFRIGEISN